MTYDAASSQLKRISMAIGKLDKRSIPSAHSGCAGQHWRQRTRHGNKFQEYRERRISQSRTVSRRNQSPFGTVPTVPFRIVTSLVTRNYRCQARRPCQRPQTR